MSDAADWHALKESRKQLRRYAELMPVCQSVISRLASVSSVMVGFVGLVLGLELL